MSDSLPDNDWLQRNAGEKSFARGVDYFRKGLVEIGEVSNTALVAKAFGSDTYRLWLKREDDDWNWHCDCPAADDGSFCKHLVAAVLTARDGADDGVGDVAVEVINAQSSFRRSASKAGELRDFLRAQPSERLAEWLYALAQRHSDVEQQLQLHRAAENPGALKAVLTKALTARGFLDYRRTREYANRLGAVIEQLQGVLARDPTECQSLCEYALKRLFKAYENSDDSHGYLGSQLQDVAELYVKACAAAPPGKALAKPLLALQALDDWDLLPLSAFWAALGAQGQAAYARRTVDEFDALPPPAPNAYDMTGHAVCRRTEALARCSDDFDLLQRVLRRDLSMPHHHQQVLKSLRDAGRAREALAWAESAVKQFPRDSSLLEGLAECLEDAGLSDEALEQEWLRFQLHSSTSTWDALKRRAGDDWPSWRERALALVTERKRDHATHRVDLLIHDGDLVAAVAVANANPVMPHTLLALASRIRRDDPLTAGAFFLRVARLHARDLRTGTDYRPLVETLAAASRLLPGTEWRPLLVEVRQTHARKPKLIGMLDTAGLLNLPTGQE